MSHWADRISERKLSQKADEHIELERHSIAVAETPRIESLLRKDMERSVNLFSQSIGGVEGPSTTLDGYTKYRTLKWPLAAVEFCFDAARIVFRKYYRASLAGDPNTSTEIIRIRGEFNGEPWFDYNGDRLNTIEEVSELLLLPLFDSVK